MSSPNTWFWTCSTILGESHPAASAAVMIHRIAWKRKVPDPQAGSRADCSRGLSSTLAVTPSASQSGGVVLAHAFTHVGVDDRLVEDFQRVVVNVRPVEHLDALDGAGEVLLAAIGKENPVEEPGLDDVVDPGLPKLVTAK